MEQGYYIAMANRVAMLGSASAANGSRNKDHPDLDMN
jgi:hypothetical protein